LESKISPFLQFFVLSKSLAHFVVIVSSVRRNSTKESKSPSVGDSAFLSDMFFSLVSLLYSIKSSSFPKVGIDFVGSFPFSSGDVEEPDILGIGGGVPKLLEDEPLEELEGVGELGEDFSSTFPK